MFIQNTEWNACLAGNRKMINRPTLILLICSLVLVMAKPGLAAERWQDENYINNSFIEIAMKREYQPGVPAKLLRWQKPLKIRIISELGDATLQQQMYRVQAQHLSAITGRAIHFVTAESKANIIVVFTSAARMKENTKKYISRTSSLDDVLQEAVCIGHVQRNDNYEINRGVILIPVDLARARGRFLDCIVEELTQVMGLTNDSDKVYPSIFNDVSTNSYLTGLDYLLLKIAYHPDLHPGMSEDKVRSLLPGILRQLRDQGEIKHANRRVLKGSMKVWAGD